MKKEEDYYTEPTEQQRVKLKRYWIIDKVAALEYFKQIYNLTALNKKKYRYTDRDEEGRQRHQSDESWENGLVPNFAEWDDCKYRIKYLEDEENDRDEDEVNYRDEDEIYKDELPF